MNQKNANDTFNEIIELTERTSELMEAFAGFDAADRESILADYFAKELDSLGEKDEISIRLFRTAEMLIGVGTPKVAALLGQGLDHDNLDVRMLTGDVLMHLAEDGLESIMPAVDAVLAGSDLAQQRVLLVADTAQPMSVAFLPHVVDADGRRIDCTPWTCPTTGETASNGGSTRASWASQPLLQCSYRT